MFGSGTKGLDNYVSEGEEMRKRHNEFLQRMMEEARQSRENYLGWLQNQQDIARRESERLRNQLMIQAYGEIQEAEPLEREADAFVVEEADARVCECIGCLQNQPNQLAHMDPGGCLYDESDEEDDYVEDGGGRPPEASQLTRETTEHISFDDEVIVLNGEYIVCG